MEVNLQSPVGAFSTAVPGEEGPTVRPCGMAHQGVVDGTSEDTQFGQAGHQKGPLAFFKPAFLRKCLAKNLVCLQTGEAQRRRYSGQHRITLKCRVACQCRPQLKN